MKKLMKIVKLNSGFLIGDKEGHQFFYASWQEVADEIFKILKSTDSKELSIMVE